MTTRRRHANVNGLSKTLRDYMVPIIWLFLILLVIFSFFNDDDTDDIADAIKYENQVPLNVTLDSDLTEAYIVYPWENKVQIEWEQDLYKWEQILVKDWTVSLNFLSVWNFRLNKLWELLYNEEWEFELDSSDLFISADTNIVVNMKYAKVFIGANSIVSLYQNETSSNVYLLSWNVEVRNLVWESTLLAKWQTISISRLEASSEDLDLSANRESIDEFYKTSDWFILNNWDYYLSLKDEIEEENTQTGSLLTTWFSSKIITFDNLFDESYVSSSSINISWRYTDESITKILVNNKEATLNASTKTFTIEGVWVSNSENDLVFKIYDDANDLLQKFIYVVYYKSWNSTSSSSSAFKVQNYDVDATQFRFTAPSTTWIYTTTSWFITIEGAVYAEWIERVTVNDYSLSSFNWTTWRYHASVDYNNLKNGTNVYVINYYDINNNLVYTNNYIIIKKIPGETSSTSDTNKVVSVYSDEASVD